MNLYIAAMQKRFFSPFGFLPFILILTISTPKSWGWIGTGHKVVALIAWDDLTPKTREAVTALLKQHRQYDQDLLEDAPADESPADKDRTAFATAATWPDQVRDQDNPMHTLYSHPDWHYIDIPYVLKGQAVVEKPAPGPGPHNAADAYVLNLQNLKDTARSPSERAVALCWIEHIVGDIHQPLHSTSLFSPEFPKGDQGGNAELELRDPPYPDSKMKLHLIWDSLPGDFHSEELVRYEAQGLRGDPLYSREKMKEALAVTDFMAWAKESHEIAVHDVYLDGNLKSAPASAGHGRQPAGADSSIPGLPHGYLEKAEHVAMKQVTLAGYRLADVLNGIFDPK